MFGVIESLQLPFASVVVVCVNVVLFGRVHVSVIVAPANAGEIDPLITTGLVSGTWLFGPVFGQLCV